MHGWRLDSVPEGTDPLLPPNPEAEDAGRWRGVVLGYFSRSPFWDPHVANSSYATLGELEAAVRDGTVEGRWYSVETARPGMQTPQVVVVSQWYRPPGARRLCEAVWYIVQGSVFPCPSVASLLQSKLAAVSSSLSDELWRRTDAAVEAIGEIDHSGDRDSQELLACLAEERRALVAAEERKRRFRT
eukprot:TRINITY_DN28786_c0_g1_i2.p2 TRINITY_DN28786_c0_g1~~TRINITY_DN28786_c0_g1_i2.p2  ORF type:complete len:187 (+),score=41.47 TRINITY_DN28786_c0_g1_i2:92-652(+)